MESPLLCKCTGSAIRRCPLRVSWLEKFNSLLQKTVLNQEKRVRAVRNLWKRWVWLFLRTCLKKGSWGHVIYLCHAFELCFLHFPLHFGVINWRSAYEVGEVFWQNPFAMIDLESPLMEGALTLLNSYFQKHKTYQNTCEDQLSHSILSNLLLPNCNLFLETRVQMGETFQAKWEEEYLCLQFAMVPLFTLWSLVHGTHVLQNISKKL